MSVTNGMKTWAIVRQLEGQRVLARRRTGSRLPQAVECCEARQVLSAVAITVATPETSANEVETVGHDDQLAQLRNDIERGNDSISLKGPAYFSEPAGIANERLFGSRPAKDAELASRLRPDGEEGYSFQRPDQLGDFWTKEWRGDREFEAVDLVRNGNGSFSVNYAGTNCEICQISAKAVAEAIGLTDDSYHTGGAAVANGENQDVFLDELVVADTVETTEPAVDCPATVEESTDLTDAVTECDETEPEKIELDEEAVAEDALTDTQYVDELFSDWDEIDVQLE